MPGKSQLHCDDDDSSMGRLTTGGLAGSILSSRLVNLLTRCFQSRMTVNSFCWVPKQYRFWSHFHYSWNRTPLSCVGRYPYIKPVTAPEWSVWLHPFWMVNTTLLHVQLSDLDLHDYQMPIAHAIQCNIDPLKRRGGKTDIPLFIPNYKNRRTISKGSPDRTRHNGLAVILLIMHPFISISICVYSPYATKWCKLCSGRRYGICLDRTLDIPKWKRISHYCTA